MGSPARGCRRRRTLPALLACLTLAVGCAEVQKRQWGYPNGNGRLSDLRKGLTRVGKARAPQVNLRVEADPADGPGPRARGTPE